MNACGKQTLEEARATWSPHKIATAALDHDDYLHYVQTCARHAAADLEAAGATYCEVRHHVLCIHDAVNRQFMDRSLFGEIGHA